MSISAESLWCPNGKQRNVRYRRRPATRMSQPSLQGCIYGVLRIAHPVLTVSRAAKSYTEVCNAACDPSVTCSESDRRRPIDHILPRGCPTLNAVTRGRHHLRHQLHQTLHRQRQFSSAPRTSMIRMRLFILEHLLNHRPTPKFLSR